MQAFQHRIRVRYAETDAQGVAHHAAYVPWLEEARIEALRSLGQCYRSLETSGTFMPVTEVRVRYRSALHFDDVVELTTTVTPVGRTQLRFDTELTRDAAAIAEASVTVAAVNGSGRPVRVPADVMAALEG